MDVDTFLHVDDGLLLGPSWTIHWLIEHVTGQNHDPEYVAKLQKLKDPFVLGGDDGDAPLEGTRRKQIQNTSAMWWLCWGWRTLIPLQHRASSGRRAEAGLYALTTGIPAGKVTKHLMNEHLVQCQAL